MLAIGRALIGEPRLLLIDEPSEGLAPIIVNEIFDLLARMRSQGIALLVVEQNVRRAAAISDFCYVMEKGRSAWRAVGGDGRRSGSTEIVGLEWGGHHRGEPGDAGFTDCRSAG